MNKKGFTLVELLVSVLLVSVVLAIMFATLVKLRKNYSLAYTDSNAVIYSASVARLINDDILDNNGIKYISCDGDGDTCNFILGNDAERELKIIDNTVSGGCVKTCRSSESCSSRCDNKSSNPESCKNTCIKKTLVSTIRYTDTSRLDSHGESKLLYIKTLSMDIETDALTQTKTSNGYGFFNIKFNQYKYKYREQTNNKDYTDYLTNVTVHMYDGLNSFDSTYDINVYSTSSIEKNTGHSGELYQIIFDTTNTDIIYIDRLYLKYNVGFYRADKTTPITKFLSSELPVGSNGKTFKGYVYTDPEDHQSIYVIDQYGNIVAPNTLFTSSVTLTPIFE